MQGFLSASSCTGFCRPAKLLASDFVESTSNRYSPGFNTMYIVHSDFSSEFDAITFQQHLFLFIKTFSYSRNFIFLSSRLFLFFVLQLQIVYKIEIGQLEKFLTL